MKPVTVLDVAGLPDHAFGHRSILWWGTLGFMATEGMAFALAAATYLYLSARVPEWPPDVPRWFGSPGSTVAVILVPVTDPR